MHGGVQALRVMRHEPTNKGAYNSECPTDFSPHVASIPPLPPPVVGSDRLKWINLNLPRRRLGPLYPFLPSHISCKAHPSHLPITIILSLNLHPTMQVNTLLRFSGVCPFLGHASPATLRTLAKTHGVSNMSSLTTRALACPMMGPQLAAIGQARAYASVAANKDIAEMHNVSASAGYFDRQIPRLPVADRA